MLHLYEHERALQLILRKLVPADASCNGWALQLRLASEAEAGLLSVLEMDILQPMYHFERDVALSWPRLLHIFVLLANAICTSPLNSA